MADLAVETVAERLRDRATRSATLTALESHAAPIPTAVSLAAAPALVELMAMDAAEVERDAFDRAGLLVGRLGRRRVEGEVCVAPVVVFASPDHAPSASHTYVGIACGMAV